MIQRLTNIIKGKIRGLSKPVSPPTYEKIDWGFSCGRHYLKVAGFVVAMEGDPCRDIDLCATDDAESELVSTYFRKDVWDKKKIFAVVRKANGKVLDQFGKEIFDDLEE